MNAEYEAIHDAPPPRRVRVALFATAVPLPMGGLGALEATLASLYGLFGFSSALGLLVSLAYRLATILVAVGGIGIGVMTMSGGSAAPVSPAVAKEASTELSAVP